MTYRIAILGLHHESNTFYPTPTPLSDFQNSMMSDDAEEIRAHFTKAHHEMGGFLEVLDGDPEVEGIPLFFANATPSGPVTAEAEHEIFRRMFARLDAAGHLDGILLSPHGAGVGVEHPDLDGYWLSEVRKRVGPKMPLISTFDPHGNLSARMVSTVDASLAYRTNPHLDMRQRGVEAAKLMLRTVRGEVHPVHAAAYPPVAINIERQSPGNSPCKAMYDRFHKWLEHPKMLTGSIFLGFPYADVAEMGSAFTFTADGDQALAQQAADDMAEYLIKNRELFRGVLYDVNEALSRASKAEGPVCLLDMGDNVGGGSPADGTLIAHGLLQRGMGPSTVTIFDEAAASAAHGAGKGAMVQLSVGGHTDPIQGKPIEGKFRVAHLSDGHFEEHEARHGGRPYYEMGPTAVLQLNDLSIIVTSRRTSPFSLGTLISAGLDPSKFNYMVAKGVHAPVAAYAPVCKSIIRINTPGITTADMNQLQYKRRRKPMFPFEEIV